VFAALVLATFAAFFVTTRLKRSPPVVEQLSFKRHFSPNADGRADSSPVSFRLRNADDVTVSIVNEDGDPVAVLADDVKLSKGRHRYVWNGRTEDGDVAPDGIYFPRIGLRHKGRTITSPRKMFLDTTPPESLVRYVSPDVISPDGTGGSNRATVRFAAPKRIAPTLLVYRTDGSRARLVARRTGKRDSGRLSWDGQVGLGATQRPAPAGNYLMAVRTRDAAGNDGPAVLPPTRKSVRGNPGVIVRYLAAVGPAESTPAGQSASFKVLADGRRYRWSVRRLGSQRALSRGTSRARDLRVRTRQSSRSGVYLLDLSLGSHRYATPFAVQGRRHAKVLLVLPQTTWEARNPVDTNADGFADLLPLDRAVESARPMAGDGLPPAFGSQVVPVLDYLDRSGLRYDIATDTDLSSDLLENYAGVLYAGPPVFSRVEVGRAVREWARAGGSVAWLGTGGFTSTVRELRGSLVLTRWTPNGNLFGERLRADPIGGLLSVERDEGELLEGVASPFGPLDQLETQVAGLAIRSSAGIDGGPPAIVLLGYGRGFAIRIGASGFARSLEPATGLESSGQIMGNLWNLLRS